MTPTSLPIHAVMAWADDNAIYTALPNRDGTWYIQRHTLSESGLSRALRMMRMIYTKAQTKGKIGSGQKTLSLLSANQSQFSPAQRAAAQMALDNLKTRS